MSVVEQVRRDREDLARVLKKHRGIRKIVEDLYPDSAHFIYELLQNAEDTEASEVSFSLSKERLVFKHNGRPFDEADIRAITDIGEGTKAADDDKIGRFGIGFKAVFAYTDSPRIWSPTFAFEISDMVRPTEIALKPSLGDRTRFEFPFDSSKKPAGDAFCEVKAGLEEISAETLLFLSHIESIDWRVEGETGANLLRVSHSDHHVEALKERDGKATKSSHFLRFTQPVEGLDKQYVAIAFELDPLPGGSSSSTNVPLAKRFRIVPAKPGRVAVYFHCAKETSGLRFHLHAPFVPELSRASVKDTSANEPLFQLLAGLAADSLSIIRGLGLLDRDFLAVLPNPSDNLSARYECIRDAIVDAMNKQPLTPTHSGRHKPAERLLQAGAVLKNLLSTKDIAILRGSEGSRNDWAVGATQRNNDVDRFLRSLDIEEWNVDRLVGPLKRLRKQFYMKYDGPDEKRLLEWLRSKPDEWHQSLYALLYREFENRMSQVRDLYIVRLSTGEYRPGDQCYFPTDEVRRDPILPRVARDTYTSGDNKAEQDRARKFLEAVGVREVGEREHVEAVLERRYSDEAEGPDKQTHGKDLQRFIGFVEASPMAANIFEDYHIFKCEDDSWRKPSEVYLDTPYSETGLHAFFKMLHDEDELPVALADHYLLELRIRKEKLVEFAKATGAQTKLVPKKQRIGSHPDKNQLRQDCRGGARERWDTSINEDWTIPNLRSALRHPSEEISRLIWNTMMKAKREVLEAKYRPNKTYPKRTARSTLILTLRELPWVPQRNGGFVRPAKASRDLLPEGFVFDPGWAWLTAIDFGAEGANRHEERRIARNELGCEDDQALEDAKRFTKLDPNTRRRILAEQEAIANLPDPQPGNPVRRAERVRREAKNAPGRETNTRNRSVSVHREPVKEEARPYLREQYTNSDDVMICQVCKNALPFRLDDERYYFEAVEFLPMLERRHYQNYLALCPNHAAMYVHANGSRETMMELFLDLHGNELEVVLANEDETIYFTGTHIADLEAVIEAESSDQ